MNERIAFVANALTGPELTRGIYDSKKVFNILTSDAYCKCSKDSSTLLTNCSSYHDFHERYREILYRCKNKQLIFYFSGHGSVMDPFSLQVGIEEKDYYIFNHLLDELYQHNITKAIFILDACYSGKALKGIKANQPNPISNLKVPKGIAIIASSRAYQESEELSEGTNSVFTHLFCDAVETGLSKTPTSDGYIHIDQLIKYIEKKMDEPQYSNYKQRPVYMINDADGAIWVAVNKSGTIEQDANRKLHKHNLKNEFSKPLKTEMPCRDAKIHDLDSQAVNNYAALINEPQNKGESENSYYVKLGLLTSYKDRLYPNIAGILCFGKKPSLFVPQAEIVFTTNSNDYENQFMKDIYGPIVKQIQIAGELVNKYFIKESIDKVPFSLIREVIANALVHRDYSHPSTIQIHCYADRLVVQNPGKFQPGFVWRKIIKGEIRKLSIPNDPLLMRFLANQKATERTGLGFEEIRKYCKEYGLDKISIEAIENTFIKITIRKPDAPNRRGTDLQNSEEVNNKPRNRKLATDILKKEPEDQSIRWTERLSDPIYNKNEQSTFAFNFSTVPFKNVFLTSFYDGLLTLIKEKKWVEINGVSGIGKSYLSAELMKELVQKETVDAKITAEGKVPTAIFIGITLKDLKDSSWDMLLSINKNMRKAINNTRIISALNSFLSDYTSGTSASRQTSKTRFIKDMLNIIHKLYIHLDFDINEYQKIRKDIKYLINKSYAISRDKVYVVTNHRGLRKIEYDKMYSMVSILPMKRDTAFQYMHFACKNVELDYKFKDFCFLASGGLPGKINQLIFWAYKIQQEYGNFAFDDFTAGKLESKILKYKTTEFWHVISNHIKFDWYRKIVLKRLAKHNSICHSTNDIFYHPFISEKRRKHELKLLSIEEIITLNEEENSVQLREPFTRFMINPYFKANKKFRIKAEPFL